MTVSEFETKWDGTPEYYWISLQDECGAKLLFMGLGSASNVIDMVHHLRAVYVGIDTVEGYRRAAYLQKIIDAFNGVMDENINENKGDDKKNTATV
jgi:hypothetical protein